MFSSPERSYAYCNAPLSYRVTVSQTTITMRYYLRPRGGGRTKRKETLIQLQVTIRPTRSGADYAAVDPETRERTARASAGRGGTGTGTFAGTRDRTARLVVECGAEGGLGDCLDREELIRKRAVLRVILIGIMVRRAEGGEGEGQELTWNSRPMPSASDYVEELDELAPDTVVSTSSF
jgi:hypothetical protein